jgi:hypothetical protein
MAGPGDQKAAAAAGRGHLRASHADREQMIDALKVAFVQGRLTKAEFDAPAAPPGAEQRSQVGRIGADYARHSCRRFGDRYRTR